MLVILAAIAYFGRPYYAGLIAQAMPAINQMLPNLANVSPIVAIPTLNIEVPIIAGQERETAMTKTSSSLIGFDVPCAASMVVRRADGSVVPWAVDLRVVSVEVMPEALRLNFEIVRTGNTNQQWPARSPTDNIALRTDTNEYGLKREGGAGGFFDQSVTLRPNETHQGWLVFDEPDMDAFEFVHPNVKPHFQIDLMNRQCKTS